MVWISKTTKKIPASLLTMVLAVTTVVAQDASKTDPATTPAPPTQPAVSTRSALPGEVLAQLRISIVAVKGLAQYRLDEESPWQPAKAGVKLTTGAEFRTGPRSRIQFAVGADHTIVLDRLGVIKVLDAIKQDGKVYTEMGMKYGRSSYRVQKGGVEHESRIRTPSATLAVRGSKGMIQEYAGRVPVAGSDYGQVAFVNTRGFEIAMKPKTRLRGHQTAAAQQSRHVGTFIPTVGGLTPKEKNFIPQQPLFGTPGSGGGGHRLPKPPPPPPPPPRLGL